MHRPVSPGFLREANRLGNQGNTMDTAKIIEEAMPSIKDEVTRALTKSIMQSITYETTEEIRKTVVKELIDEAAA